MVTPYRSPIKLEVSGEDHRLRRNPPGRHARVPHRLAADAGAGRCGVPGQSRCHAPRERQRQRCGRGARARRPAPPPGPMAGAGPGSGSKFDPTSEAVGAALPPGMIAGSKVPLRSCGTAGSTAPCSVSTVLPEGPLRLLPLPLPRARRIALLVAPTIGQPGARRPLRQRLLPLPEEARRRPEGLPASGNRPAIRLEAQVEASSSQVLLHKIWAPTRSLTQNIGQILDSHIGQSRSSAGRYAVGASRRASSAPSPAHWRGCNWPSSGSRFDASDGLKPLFFPKRADRTHY